MQMITAACRSVFCTFFHGASNLLVPSLGGLPEGGALCMHALPLDGWAYTVTQRGGKQIWVSVHM